MNLNNKDLNLLYVHLDIIEKGISLLSRKINVCLRINEESFCIQIGKQ